MSASARDTSIGTSYYPLNADFLSTVLPLVDVVEITPESLAQWEGGKPRIPARIVQELREIADRAKIIVHGVGLSIGSYDSWADHSIVLLDQLLDSIPVAWHSEHLGFITVDGTFLGTILSLPRTQEVLDIVCDRVERLQHRYRLPFLLENVANLLPDPPGEMSDAAFFNSIVERTGCELLLDLYNLDCDAQNGRIDTTDFFLELRLEHVRELHVAGGTRHCGLLLDIHSRITPESTNNLLKCVRYELPALKAVIYELMPEAVPALGFGRWASEIRRIAGIIKEAPCDYSITNAV